MTTAACLIIGDEILTGKVHDQNSHTLAKVLFERGVRLHHIETIRDHTDVIAEAVARLSAGYDLVFTTGGIGPTHDDVTYAAIAQAFGRELEENAEVLAQMAEHYAARGTELNAARRRMATFPAGAQLLRDDPDLWVPVVRVENVHIFPGVPALFSRMLDAVAHRFSGERLAREVVLTAKTEGTIAKALGEINDRYASVAIGSYPQFQDADGVAVRITLEGTNPAEVQAAAKEVQAAVEGWLPPAPGA